MIPELMMDKEEDMSSTRASGDDPDALTQDDLERLFYPRKRG